MAEKRRQQEQQRTRVEFGSSARVIFGSTLASAGIGLFFAMLQVQGWTVPKPLAIFLGVVLLGVASIGVAIVAMEAMRFIRRFLEHRATSASWVRDTPPGLLDYPVDGVRAQNKFTSLLKKLNKDTSSLGRKLERHRRRMERLQGASARRRQRAANRSAKSIDKSAVFIEKRLELLRALVKDIERNTRGLIEAITSAEEMEVALGLREALDDGSTTTAETLTSVEGYRDGTEEMEGMNLSRTLRIACGRLASGLRGIEAVFRAHEKAMTGLVRDLDRKHEEWRRKT